MKFTLLVGTLNRAKEIEECLKSILNQTFKEYEIIVVDQSINNDTEIVVKNMNIDCKYYHVEFTGLSKARNYGIERASGEYVCLLDDDAVYPKDFLEKTCQYLQKNKKAILSGVIKSINDYSTPFINYSKYRNFQVMGINGVLNACPSAALIIPYDAFKRIGKFDERLGVGNEFASGEESDFLLRCVSDGFRVIHCKDIVVYHPIKPINYRDLSGVYKHAMGKGALFKIDLLSRYKTRLFVFAFKNTIGMTIKSAVSKEPLKKYYLERKKGFIDGYRKFVIHR